MKKWRPVGAEWANLKILNPLEPEGGIYEKHESWNQHFQVWMFYKCVIELSSCSYVGAHLSRFQQLLITVSLPSYNEQKYNSCPWSWTIQEIRELEYPIPPRCGS